MNTASEKAQYYRDQADKLRAMAATEYNDKSRMDLLVLANQYDGLANKLLGRAIRNPPDSI